MDGPAVGVFVIQWNLVLVREIVSRTLESRAVASNFRPQLFRGEFMSRIKRRRRQARQPLPPLAKLTMADIEAAKAIRPAIAEDTAAYGIGP